MAPSLNHMHMLGMSSEKDSLGSSVSHGWWVVTSCKTYIVEHRYMVPELGFWVC